MKIYRSQHNSIKTSTVKCSRMLRDWDKEYSVRECYPWNESEDVTDEDLVETLEANGRSVFKTLGEACQNIFDFYGDDVESALEGIEAEWMNLIDPIPLNQFNWSEQKDIYLDWLTDFHPEINIEGMRD